MSEKQSPVVVLVNRALPYNTVGQVTGRTGIQYGSSFFDDRYGAHVCTMTPEQWKECKQDVTEGALRRWQQWEVDYEFPDEPVNLDKTEAAITAAKDAGELDLIVQTLSPFIQSVVARSLELAAPKKAAKEKPVEKAPDVVKEQPTESTEDTTSSSSASSESESSESSATALSPRALELEQITNYRSLLSVARKAGVEKPETFNSTPELRAAILLKEGE